MNINIRRVVFSDAECLSEVAARTFFDTFTGTCTEEDMQSFLIDYFNLTQVQLELSNPEDYYFFAEVDGKVVGYIRFMEDYSALPFMKKWKALELKRLYIEKEYHGQGVAQALMDYFLNFANENFYEAVWLGVWEFNIRAQKFYKKYGFENSGFTHDFPIGNTPQTDWWFWKMLKE